MKYILRAGTKIQRSMSRTALPGIPWGWEDFTTTKDAIFSADDLITSKVNGLVVVRIPTLDGSVRPDGWQSIQFDFMKLGVLQLGVTYPAPDVVEKDLIAVIDDKTFYNWLGSPTSGTLGS